MSSEPTPRPAEQHKEAPVRRLTYPENFPARLEEGREDHEDLERLRQMLLELLPLQGAEREDADIRRERRAAEDDPDMFQGLIRQLEQHIAEHQAHDDEPDWLTTADAAGRTPQQEYRDLRAEILAALRTVDARAFWRRRRSDNTPAISARALPLQQAMPIDTRGVITCSPSAPGALATLDAYVDELRSLQATMASDIDQDVPKIPGCTGREAEDCERFVYQLRLRIQDIRQHALWQSPYRMDTEADLCQEVWQLQSVAHNEMKINGSSDRGNLKAAPANLQRIVDELQRILTIVEQQLKARNAEYEVHQKDVHEKAQADKRNRWAATVAVTILGVLGGTTGTYFATRPAQPQNGGMTKKEHEPRRSTTFAPGYSVAVDGKTLAFTVLPFRKFTCEYRVQGAANWEKIAVEGAESGSFSIVIPDALRGKTVEFKLQHELNPEGGAKSDMLYRELDVPAK